VTKEIDKELKKRYRELVSEYERKFELLKEEAIRKIIVQLEKEIEFRNEKPTPDDPIFDPVKEILDRLHFDEEEKEEILLLICSTVRRSMGN